MRGPAWKLILSLARRQMWGLAVGFLALVGVDLVQLYVPRIIKHAVDDLTLATADAASLLSQALLVLGLAAAAAGLRSVWRPFIMGYARTVERDLRQAMFDHLQALDVGYFTENPPGELMARASNDLNNIRMAAGIGLVAAVDGLLLGLAAVAFMVYISPLLALLAVLPMPLVIWTTRVQSRKMHQGFVDVQEGFAGLTEQAREALAGIRLLKAYALGRREEARLLAAGQEFMTINLGLVRIMAFFWPAMIFFTNLSLAVVVGAGGPLAVFGQITPGDFVAFTAYLGMLTWPMMALGWVVSLMQRAKTSLVRVSQVLETEPAVADPPQPKRLPARPEQGIAIRDLTFTYPGADRPSLSDVSLRLPAGGTVAVVGPVGSGKSSLLALLGRLYEPPAGAVFVEGTDVRELAQADLRGHLVQVPQEAFLFSATVAQNLALGRPDADRDSMWRALTQAELADEVRELPQGLDTRLGEKATSLSGGQRQRLALARALLLDAPVLALDDPLSAVDTDTESRILANLARLRAGKSNLVVSHRLASVAFADHIYVLDQGRVVEEGGHRELLAAGGLYHRLFAEQALLAELEA